MAVSEGSVWEFSLGLTAISTYKREEMHHVRTWQHIFIIRLWVKGYVMSCTLKETVYCSSCKLLNIYIFSKHCIIKGWKGWLDLECFVLWFCFVFYDQVLMNVRQAFDHWAPKVKHLKFTMFFPSRCFMLYYGSFEVTTNTYNEWSFNGKKSQSSSW